ncbi:DUF58 domain-containing protein [Limnoglobus roseus]|uniref:DUF58 domain-containing protein n=1 Tax=Limnoglobus roseus TaxID=2598579 RepID=A0A5C1ALS4_9BACT|nr:DUF58 domain-containing protein [Limnoglobus roseus]QEL19103.1 hypothetical protein PX52LOC_06160 [Limnoglobus roseus]
MTPLPAHLLAQIDRLELEARQLVEGHLAGRHKSPQHGFAVEFAQHREYAPGDDIKHIDWKVFARTERYHLKQYEQETNLVAWMVVDASESMRFRSGGRSKYEVACSAAAALAFLILQQTDSVGLVTFADGVRHFLRPSARAGNHFREILKLLLDGPAATPADTGKVLDEVAGRLGRRGIVFLFSDLLDDVPPLIDGLRHLKFQKHEVVVFQVMDGAELDFPFRHPTLFRGLENWPELSTDPLSIRESYLTELGNHLGQIQQACRTLEADYVRLRTDADLGHELSIYLRRRFGK